MVKVHRSILPSRPMACKASATKRTGGLCNNFRAFSELIAGLFQSNAEEACDREFSVGAVD